MLTATAEKRHHPGQEVDLQDRARLGTVIDDVERLDQRLHAGIGAPQRDDEAQQERAEIGLRPHHQLVDVIVDEHDHVGGHDLAEAVDEGADIGRVADQPIERDEGGEAGKDRQHHEEGGRGGDAGQIVRHQAEIELVRQLGHQRGGGALLGGVGLGDGLEDEPADGPVEERAGISGRFAPIAPGQIAGCEQSQRSEDADGQAALCVSRSARFLSHVWPVPQPGRR